MDPNLTNERRASISKAVTDLLKDVLKKWRQQEKECEEEAKAAGVNIINASIKPPLKKKSKSLPFNSFTESANRLTTLGAIHIEAPAARTQVIARISIFDPGYDPTFSSFGSDDNYIWANIPMPVAVGVLPVSAGLKDVIALAAAKLPQGGFGPRRLLGALADPDLNTGRLLQYVALESDSDVQAWLASLPNASTVRVLLVFKCQNPLSGRPDFPASPSSNWLP